MFLFLSIFLGHPNRCIWKAYDSPQKITVLEMRKKFISHATFLDLCPCIFTRKDPDTPKVLKASESVGKKKLWKVTQEIDPKN